MSGSRLRDRLRYPVWSDVERRPRAPVRLCVAFVLVGLGLLAGGVAAVVLSLPVPLSTVLPMLAVAAFFGLVLNTAGSAGDLYIVWRLGRYPPGTLSYDADIRHMYVFVPEE